MFICSFLSASCTIELYYLQVLDAITGLTMLLQVLQRRGYRRLAWQRGGRQGRRRVGGQGHRRAVRPVDIAEEVAAESGAAAMEPPAYFALREPLGQRPPYITVVPVKRIALP